MAVYKSVKIIPNAPKTELREMLSNGVQKIAVSAPAQKGKANKELLRFVRKLWGTQVRIVAGESSREKVLFIGDESLQE